MDAFEGLLAEEKGDAADFAREDDGRANSSERTR
jgi:hypothetical protein